MARDPGLEELNWTLFQAYPASQCSGAWRGC